MASSSRKVYYRKARISGGVDRTLQQLLSAALDSQKLVKQRLEATDTEATEFRIISSSQKIDGHLCGRLTIFARGGYQTVIADDEDATSLPLRAEPPPNHDGVQHQFVPGILYFCVFDNHVVLIQSAALKASGLEHHLAWLLRDKTNALTATQGVALVDVPTQATKDRIRKSHVKSVKLGRPLMEETTLDGQQVVQGTASTKFRPTGPVMSLIREMMDPTEFDRLNLAEKVFDGNLDVWIEIRYPKNFRMKLQSNASYQLLDDLAIALRDIDDGQATLQLADGTQVTGDELRITGSVDVKVKDGVCNEEDLYSNMVAWLKNRIQDRVIDA